MTRKFRRPHRTSRPPIGQPPFELRVEKMVPGGEGLGFREGKAVFVRGALPGETVRVRLTERRRDYERGEPVEILDPSPHRVEPACPAAASCGGCDWIHIRESEQLRLKVEAARDAFRRVGGFDVPDLAVESGRPWGYRNRIHIHRDASGRAGFMARGSRSPVRLSGCPVALPPLNELFRNADGRPGRFPAWAHMEPGGKPFLLGGDNGADGEVRLEVLGRPFVFGLRCFFQGNLEMLERLVPFAVDSLAGRTALDLYAGVGLFGAFLGETFGRVVCVEGDAMSLGYARRNVAGAHAFRAGKVEEWMAGDEAEALLQSGEVDAVLADPPRAGLHGSVVAALSASRAKRLVYVSCNPVTLARDIGALLRAGWDLETARLFDFFPQTSHVEAVARLARRA